MFEVYTAAKPPFLRYLLPTRGMVALLAFVSRAIALIGRRLRRSSLVHNRHDHANRKGRDNPGPNCCFISARLRLVTERV